MGKMPSCISPECIKTINMDNDVKRAVDENLNTAGTSIDALHATIAKANEYIQQGAGDRKKKADIQKWKDAMTKYKAEMKQLPSEYKDAEKHYISLAGWAWPGQPEQTFSGDAAYNNKMFYDYLQTADKKKITALAENKIITQRLHTLVDSYRTGLVYANKMEDLLHIRENENDNLHNAMKEMRNATLTNDRRVFYEDKERHRLAYNRYILYYFLYGFFIMYFVFGSNGLTMKTLRTQGFYKEQTFWWMAIFDIAYLTLPIWVDWFVRMCFRIYIGYFTHNIAPRKYH
jgi:hypothetical protein